MEQICDEIKEDMHKIEEDSKKIVEDRSIGNKLLKNNNKLINH